MLIDAGLRRYVCNGQKPAWQRDGEECLLYPVGSTGRRNTLIF
jgi:hypothetical protein